MVADFICEICDECAHGKEKPTSTMMSRIKGEGGGGFVRLCNRRENWGIKSARGDGDRLVGRCRSTAPPFNQVSVSNSSVLEIPLLSGFLARARMSSAGYVRRWGGGDRDVGWPRRYDRIRCRRTRRMEG
jgi:hypothetical protein